MKCPSHPMMSAFVISTIPGRGHLAKAVSVRLFHSTVTLSLSTLFIESEPLSLDHLGVVGIKPHLLTAKNIYIYCLKFFCVGDLSLLIYLLIQSFIYMHPSKILRIWFQATAVKRTLQ